VREFVEEVCKNLGYNIVWKGKGVKEVGVDKKTGKVLVRVDPKLFRPSETEYLIGDPSKARKILGWKPKVKFAELARIMAEHDFEYVKSNADKLHKIKVRRF
jgi:GDPmannose 4,6-dehydratase